MLQSFYVPGVTFVTYSDRRLGRFGRLSPSVPVGGKPSVVRRLLAAPGAAAWPVVNMLSQQLAAAAERLQGRPWDGHRTGRHANAQSAEAVGQFVCITRRHHQHALTDPHHAGAVDESLLFVSKPGRPLRDPPSSEDDLTHPRGDRPDRAGDIVGQQDPFSVVSFNRHHLTDSDSYIIAFPWGE